MKLNELPLEALRLIFKKRASFLAIELWKAGDKRLNDKLANGGVVDMDLRAKEQIDAVSRWPKMLKFLRLRSLSILCYSPLGSMNTIRHELSQLYRGLRSITIRSDELSEALFGPLDLDAPNDLQIEPSAKRPKLSEYHQHQEDDSSPHYMPIGELWPEMETFCDLGDRDDFVLTAAHFRLLPHTITSLTIPFACLADFPSLPPRLESLAMTTPSRVSRIPLATLLTLPSSLTALKWELDSEAEAFLMSDAFDERYPNFSKKEPLPTLNDHVSMVITKMMDTGFRWSRKLKKMQLVEGEGALLLSKLNSPSPASQTHSSIHLTSHSHLIGSIASQSIESTSTTHLEDRFLPPNLESLSFISKPHASTPHPARQAQMHEAHANGNINHAGHGHANPHLPHNATHFNHQNHHGHGHEHQHNHAGYHNQHNNGLHNPHNGQEGEDNSSSSPPLPLLPHNIIGMPNVFEKLTKLHIPKIDWPLLEGGHTRLPPLLLHLDLANDHSFHYRHFHLLPRNLTTLRKFPTTAVGANKKTSPSHVDQTASIPGESDDHASHEHETSDMLDSYSPERLASLASSLLLLADADAPHWTRILSEYEASLDPHYRGKKIPLACIRALERGEHLGLPLTLIRLAIGSHYGSTLPHVTLSMPPYVMQAMLSSQVCSQPQNFLRSYPPSLGFISIPATDSIHGKDSMEMWGDIEKERLDGATESRHFKSQSFSPSTYASSSLNAQYLAIKREFGDPSANLLDQVPPSPYFGASILVLKLTLNHGIMHPSSFKHLPRSLLKLSCAMPREIEAHYLGDLPRRMMILSIDCTFQEDAEDDIDDEDMGDGNIEDEDDLHRPTINNQRGRTVVIEHQNHQNPLNQNHQNHQNPLNQNHQNHPQHQVPNPPRTPPWVSFLPPSLTSGHFENATLDASHLGDIPSSLRTLSVGLFFNFFARHVTQLPPTLDLSFAKLAYNPSEDWESLRNHAFWHQSFESILRMRHILLPRAHPYTLPELENLAYQCANDEQMYAELDIHPRTLSKFSTPLRPIRGPLGR